MCLECLQVILYSVHPAIRRVAKHRICLGRQAMTGVLEKTYQARQDGRAKKDAMTSSGGVARRHKACIILRSFYDIPARSWFPPLSPHPKSLEKPQGNATMHEQAFKQAARQKSLFVHSASPRWTKLCKHARFSQVTATGFR